MSQSPSTNTDATGKSPEILIVEDDLVLRKITSYQLIAAGYAVKGVSGGLEALKQIQNSLPGVLILDLGLPDISGQKVVEMLKGASATSKLPLIIYTCSDFSSERHANLRLGPTRFVTKARCSNDQLPQIVAEVLACSI